MKRTTRIPVVRRAPMTTMSVAWMQSPGPSESGDEKVD